MSSPEDLARRIEHLLTQLDSVSADQLRLDERQAYADLLEAARRLVHRRSDAATPDVHGPDPTSG